MIERSEMTLMPSVPNVVAIITAARYSYKDEDTLQAGITAALASAGLPAQREARLSAKDRIDVLIGDIGIEIKLTGSITTVLRQLQRYASHDTIAALVLVTTRARQRALPNTVGGKPLTIIHIGGAA